MPLTKQHLAVSFAARDGLSHAGPPEPCPGELRGGYPQVCSVCAGGLVASDEVDHEPDKLGIKLPAGTPIDLLSSTASNERGAEYGRWLVIASNASVIRTIRVSSGLRSSASVLRAGVGQAAHRPVPPDRDL